MTRKIMWAALGAMLLLLFVRPVHAGGLESTRISLPKGPASVEGLGRSFVPSLASGTASTGLDLVLPPAAGGFGPKLSLDYDMGGGVSELGTGWRLGGLPSIRRRTNEGVPRFDSSDRLELVGIGVPGDLLQVSPGVFRPEHEGGAFVRVKQSADGKTFEARDKSGVTYRFGGSGFTEAEGNKVAAWLLREQLDLHGHVVRYAWDTSSGRALLSRVTWNDFSDATRIAVTFEYTARPDVHVLFSSGISQRLDKRLARIEVRVGAERVRSYELGYAPGARSLLETLRLVGSDGETALPTLKYAYTGGELTSSGALVTMTSPPGRTPAESSVSLADLNGDGLPDLLVSKAGAFRSYANHDGKSWRAAEDWLSTDSPSLSLDQPGVGLADFDGDGAIDLVAKSGVSQFRYFPGLDATHWSPSVAIPTVPNLSFEDPDVRLADIDGDRRIDFVATTAAGLVIGHNLGGKDFATPKTVGIIDPKQELRFSNGKTHLADVNGDGLLDLVFLRSGALTYWLGRGRGTFEPAAVATGVPTFNESDPYQLVDLNSDGWVDLVHLGVTQVSVAVATAAGQFASPVSISGTPTKKPGSFAGFADMNGSGSTDIVWADTSGSPENAWRYLELFPDGRAGLMTRIDNGLGKITRISYEPAAAHAARARDAGTPWATRMNIAMPVVSRVETDVSLGDPVMATEYVYRDGAWDAPERTFAGFAGGVERALGDEHTPTLLTDTQFDLGLALRSLRGAVRQVERRTEQGHIFDRTTSEYTSQTVASAAGGAPIVYAYKSSERVEHIEGADASAVRVTLTEWDEDEYGNQTAEYRWGEVVVGDKLAGNDEALTTRTFANDPAEWILGRTATEELTDASGTRVRMTRSYYDGAPFVGLPLGKVTRGDLTRQEAWVGPGLEEFDEVAMSKYDAHGNVLETRDARGGGRRFEWDAQSATFVLAEFVRVRDDLELVERQQVDRRFGVATEVQDYAGSTTLLGYDALGRVTRVVRPGDSEQLPSVSYAYELAAPLSRVTTELRRFSGHAEVDSAEDLIDGAGRKRASIVPDGTGADERWAISGVQLFDARGSAWRSVRARMAGPGERTSPDLQMDGPGDSSWRDAVGRSIRTLTNAGLQSRTEYHPLQKHYWDPGRANPASPYDKTPSVEAVDGLGRITSATRHLSQVAHSADFAWNAAGDLLSRTDPEGNVASYQYDGRGRRTTVVDPDVGKRGLVWDKTDNLVERRHPDGTVLRFEHDLVGRLVSEDWDGDGKPEVENVWDVHPDQPGDTSFRGKLVQTRDATGVTDHSYDHRGRSSATRLNIQGQLVSTESHFDAQDREYLHVYPDKSSIRIHYNARGQVSAYGKAVEFHYDPDGVELQRTFNTGVVQHAGYDDDRKLREIRALSSSGQVIEHVRRTYDLAGNVTKIDDLRPNVPAAESRSESYSYDDFYRLVAAEGSWGKVTWQWSPSGNLLSRTSNVAALNSPSTTYGTHINDGAGPHAAVKLGNRTLTYDALGRMKHDGVRSYTWNAVDQLQRVSQTDGASSESIFDASGARRIRIERDAAGKTKKTHVVSRWSEIREGKLVRFIVHGGQRIARLAPSTGQVKGASGARVAPTAADEPPPAPTLVPLFQRAAWPALARALAGGQLPLALLLLLQLAMALTLRRPLRACWARLSAAPVQLRRASARSSVFRTFAMTLAALGFAVACASTDSEPRSAAPIQDGSVQVLGEADSLLINDPLGSLLAETSGSGAVQARFATYPFGKTRFSTSAETELYTGAARDRGVELDLMGARSYAPDLGIWTIGDPIVVNSPESLVDSVFAVANPYAYAALTPLVAVDPDGNHPAWVVMAMGALAGASASSGIEVVSQLLENGRVTQPGRVYAAAAGGAAAGAFTGGVGGLVVGTTSKVALGSAAGVVQVATTEVVRTKGKSAGTPGQLAVGAATGGAMVGLSVTVMRGATAPKPSFSGCNQMFCWGENGGSVRKGAGDAVATGGGRGRNNLRPIPTAGGAHSTFKRNPATGELTGHAEWKPNPRNPNGFDQVKRVDTQHANPHTHHNKVTGQQVPTPHAHEKSAPGGVRPARPDELPK